MQNSQQHIRIRIAPSALSGAQCIDTLGEMMPDCQQFELRAMRVGGRANEGQTGACLARLRPHVAEGPDARMGVEATERGESMLAVGWPDDDSMVLATHELSMAFGKAHWWSAAAIVGGGVVVRIGAGGGCGSGSVLVGTLATRSPAGQASATGSSGMGKLNVAVGAFDNEITWHVSNCVGRV